MPTEMIIVGASLLVFGAVVLGVTGLGRTFGRERGTREARLRAYGIGEVAEEQWSRPFSERIALPTFEWLGRISSRLTPGQVVDSTQSRLVQAGKRTEAWFWGFFAMKAVGVVALPLLFVLAFTIMRGTFTFGIVPALVCLVLVYLGWRIPDFWLDSAISGRKKGIVKG